MPTLLEVQNRINSDFLNRNFGAETLRAVQAAVRAYERTRWTFNETSTALTTTAGQSFLDLPSNLLILDDIRLTANGESLPLLSREPQFIRDSNMSNVQGQPVFYALYQDRVELALTPDSAYSVPVYYVKSLPELLQDDDTNEWIQGGMQDVIAYHAAKLIWGTVVRNDIEAAKFQKLENDALTRIEAHHEQRRTPNRLRPTQF